MKTYYLIAIIALLFLASFASKEIHDKRVKRFVASHEENALVIQDKYKIPASIVLAQAAIESGWGRSELSKKANNYFGVKCHNWEGMRYYKRDDCEQDGKPVDCCFRAYSSSIKSFANYAKFLTGNQRYKKAFEQDNYKGWANAIWRAGYAGESDNYGGKLIDIIERYNLHVLDVYPTRDTKPVAQKKKPTKQKKAAKKRKAKAKKPVKKQKAKIKEPEKAKRVKKSARLPDPGLKKHYEMMYCVTLRKWQQSTGPEAGEIANELAKIDSKLFEHGVIGEINCITKKH